MEKEEILLENYNQFEKNFAETNRNLIFIEDVYAQKLEEIEEEYGKFFDLKTSKFFEVYKSELEDLDSKIQKCNKSFCFESAFDVYKLFLNIDEAIKNDIISCNSYSLKNSYKNGKVDDVFVFNLSMLGTEKILASIVFDGLEKLTKKLQILVDDLHNKK